MQIEFIKMINNFEQYFQNMKIGDYVFGKDTSPCYLWVKVSEDEIAPFCMRQGEPEREEKRSKILRDNLYIRAYVYLEPQDNIYMNNLQHSLDLCYKLYGIIPESGIKKTTLNIVCIQRN